jgi:site-specific recombinase XerD
LQLSGKEEFARQHIINATVSSFAMFCFIVLVLLHLLRHSVATTLLERGMPIEQIQKFLGHSKLETTQIYAESTTEMLKESYRRALTE